MNKYEQKSFFFEFLLSCMDFLGMIDHLVGKICCYDIQKSLKQVTYVRCCKKKLLWRDHMLSFVFQLVTFGKEKNSYQFKKWKVLEIDSSIEKWVDFNEKGLW